jgi:DNA-directed RNA polymerase subunit H (RpoH/RPB5)
MVNNHQIILDELNTIESRYFKLWNELLPWYDANDPIVSQRYENIAGSINYIEKLKHSISYGKQ